MKQDRLVFLFRALLVLVLLLAAGSAYVGYEVFSQAKIARQDAAARATFDMRDYIEVTAVKVHDTIEGQPIKMDVARILKRNFPGAYKVTIRKADGGTAICSTGQVDWDYQAFDQSGNPTQLPDPPLLSWWAWGGSCTSVQERGLPPGHYTVETCHYHRSPPGFSGPAGLCWRPVALFTVHPAT